MQPARNPVDELQVQLQMSQMLSHARNQLDHGQPNDALQVRPSPAAAAAAAAAHRLFVCGRRSQPAAHP